MKWIPIIAALLLALSCDCQGRNTTLETSPQENASSPSDAAPRPNPRVSPAEHSPEPNESEGDAAPPTPSCEERRTRASELLDGVLAGYRRCQWDVECVVVSPSIQCQERETTALASPGVVTFNEAVQRANTEICAAYAQNDCGGERLHYPPHAAYCDGGTCQVRNAREPRPPLPSIETPPQNRAEASGVPRPPVGDAEEQAHRLFDAIVHDDPSRIMDFFFPAEAFEVVKGIAHPREYWDRLLARFLQDIHDLHGNTPDLDRAEYVRFELATRGGWVAVREEGNRLPYWASRHSHLVYRVDGEERRLEVRVLITWGERWYVIHLNEFH